MVTPGRPVTIAVLGAGGRHVVTEALARGHTVRAAVHRTNPRPVHPRLQIQLADVRCPDKVRAALSNAGLVLSCLAESRPKRYGLKPTPGRRHVIKEVPKSEVRLAGAVGM